MNVKSTYALLLKFRYHNQTSIKYDSDRLFYQKFFCIAFVEKLLNISLEFSTHLPRQQNM
ncbi:MAG: hypothetical protein AAF378_04855 [Cyanobacteria bacterium P01_A01_bin.84]